MTQDTLTYDRAALSAMLEQCQCQLVDDPHGPQALPTSAADADTPDFVCAIPALGVLRVQGAECLTFLQGQLTNDIERLDDNQAQWTGLCSPKGRLLATFLAIRNQDGVWLLMSRELAAPIAKRLSMYVLRAKVTVTDASAQMLPLGVSGPNLQQSLSNAGLPTPESMTAEGDPLAVSLPAISVSGQTSDRTIVLCETNQIAPTWSALIAKVPAQSSAYWRSGEVISGIAQVSGLIQESFVPQMINFELVGGVDFDKGCYTGQEVVARSQYLGKMKRRMFLATVAGVPSPGDEVQDAQGKSSGTVVASGPAPAVGIDAESVVLFENRVDTDQVQVNGQPLAAIPLPYEIPEPSPFKRPI